MKKTAVMKTTPFVKRFLVLAVAMACILTLAACQNTTTAPESGDQTTEAPTTTTTQATEDLSLYIQTANELAERLALIDSCDAGVFDYDPDTVMENQDGSREHAKYLGTAFSTEEEMRAYVDATLTEQLFTATYSDLFDGDGMLDAGPRFYDVDSLLYGEITRSRTVAFQLFGSDPTIDNVTDTSFTAVFSVDDDATLTLEIVLTDGNWKINAFTVE